MTRACANCEKELGILDRSDRTKSHGMCKRHFMEFVRDAGTPEDEIQQALKEFSTTGFCPDLQQEKLTNAS